MKKTTRLSFLLMLSLFAWFFSLNAQEIGLASYYHHRFHGKLTASGERHDKNELTAAHRTYPFGTYLLVTNLANMRRVVVRVTDRGPHRRNRLIDLSEAAARQLKFHKRGLTQVRIEEVPAGIDLRALDILYPRLYFFNTDTVRVKVPLRIKTEKE